jgi:gliding motility-associated-like protein
MKRILPCLLVLICFFDQVHSQSCTATSFDVDLSASIDTTVSFQSRRNGDCCSGTNCVRFNLTINPACSFVNFDVANPAPPGNSAFYQVDCGPQTSLGTPVCIVGKTNVTITFCKPGNDDPIYTIVAAGALKGSDDITVRQGCTGTMTVAGLQPATINWTSVYPGGQGAYDSYLSCTSGCTLTNVTPLPGSPSYIDYKVSGFRLCGPLVSDTIRVFTKPQIAVAISPNNPSVCADGSTNITLNASASGGDAPYTFSWSNGQSGPSISTNSGGTYTVSVTDTNNCLPATQSMTVATIPLPAPPVLSSNSPVCQGSSLNLFASTIVGATYSWTGPNGFTSSQQNPVISNVTSANAGSYSVIVTTQCSSVPVSISIVVNPIPSSPTAANSSAVCEGSNLNLTASNIPGASYNWTGPNGFSSSSQNPVINNVRVANGGAYSVTATVNGCASSPASTSAVVNPIPAAPLASNNGPLCVGSSISLSAGAINGASYSWTGPGGFNSSSQNPTIPNATTSASGVYSVTATVNGCTGAASTTPVVVNSILPPPIVSSNGPLCVGSTLNLSASSGAGATYSWTGPNGFSSVSQNPSITNINASGGGSYSVTATGNGCTSAASSTVVVVNAIPASPTTGSNSPLCEGLDVLLTASNIAGATYAWSGPNGFSSSSQNPTIANSTFATSGIYSVTTTINGCTSVAATQSVVVNLIPISPLSSSNSPLCSGSSILLNAANLTGASYSWTGPNGFTSTQQNPVINNASATNSGTYKVSVTVNGCTSTTPASVPVTVNQTPPAPLLTNNGPLCEGSTLNLSASNIAGASYLWNGPNGFGSSSQNNSVPNVTSAYAGNYSVTATANNCVSPATSMAIVIDKPGTVNAGRDQRICSSNPSLNISGSITGGQGTATWSTSGTGSFSSATNAATTYFPSAADKAANNVVLTLASTNNGSCPASTSSVSIAFVAQPTADAGNDQVVCANNANVILNGKFNNAGGIVWSTSGNGTFSPSNTMLNATYSPGSADQIDGFTKITLTTSASSPCPAASDALTITMTAPPAIKNGVKYVLEDNSTTLNSVTAEPNLKYNWTPAIYLNNDTIANPVCTPARDILYQLIVTDAFGCTASGDIMVKILKHPEIPNVFTPNGDGINDRWQIKFLSDYPDCIVDIYDRYGQLVYQSVGYTNPWDGTCKGKQVPAATYYYIIDPKNNLKPLSGFVDIVK